MAENISFERVTTEYYDVLKELGNIGAGNATTALAQMLQTKVDMKVPQVRLLDFKDVGVVMGGEEQLVVGIYLAVEGILQAVLCSFWNRMLANRLCQSLWECHHQRVALAR